MTDHEPQDRRTKPTRALVLHPDIRGAERRKEPIHALDEAVALAAALPGLDVVEADVVPLREVRPATIFGTGKMDEIKTTIEAREVELVLIDGPVTPVQQRNLEDAWKVKLLDRTGLILEIFADRAATREGVLQVELAALSYQRTRLVRAWTHLERQRGGLGFVGGPGETQIEADRRALDEAITRIRRQLEKVTRTRGLHRAARAKVPFPVVALVGYTNAGKSTLFNRLTGAEVMAEDMLFATLDPTMRGVTLEGGTRVILSDTVGFISDLPTQLVAAFRATLEEVLAADLILHVRDVAHPDTDSQAEDVDTILGDLGVPEDVPRIELWNKADMLPEDARAALEAIADRSEDALLISALDGTGVTEAVDAITAQLEGVRRRQTVDIPFSEGRRRAWLHERDVIEAERETDEGWSLDVRWTDRQRMDFEAL
ncbi:GTPase HflX [Roseicyclus sp. F158]|uniref:GTPase HflX n=1 Tax=Tropicimonas omnivorans TaxID=3075590 RepID=A0ABU3DGR9_9RHOB|nr:GTPase HflX [Roseicyclus sp. F158]MDT0682877.1 GTPase HflX [Roseicyclus sp. F158]